VTVARNPLGICTSASTDVRGGAAGDTAELALRSVEFVTRRQVLVVGSCLWAVMGASVALAALPNVNEDARLVVALASVAFPLCALGAAAALGRQRDRLAGLLLLLSVATPTYFAYALNVVPLIVGVALLVSPGVVRRLPLDERSRRAIVRAHQGHQPRQFLS
jgi:hypothetical protein